MKLPTIWMSMVLYTEKSETDLIFSMLLWFPIPCNSIFYMSATMHWGIMVPHDFTISLEEITTGKKLHQNCKKYVYSCTDCQQVTPKEPKYINLHLPIPNFPLSFSSMDLVEPYRKMENGNQYTLTVICMLTNYIFMIPIRSKSTEHIIKACLTGVYSTFRGSKYIWSDHGSEFATKQWQKN